MNHTSYNKKKCHFNLVDYFYDDHEFDNIYLHIQMVYPYDTRFLQADGTLLVDQTDYETRLANGESVYIACFVGCTYHCG